MCLWIHNLLSYLTLLRYDIPRLTFPHNQSEPNFPLSVSRIFEFLLINKNTIKNINSET